MIYYMGNNANNSDTNGQTPNESDLNPGQTPAPQDQTVNGQKTPLETLPADIQDYIKRLRTEAEEANERKKAEAKARAKAEAAQLAEQGKYKELYEQHQLRVAELEPVAERYQDLAKQVRAQIQTETAQWPAEVKAFYPGDDAAVEQINDWYARSKPIVAKLTESKGRTPGNGPNPAPSSGTPETKQREFEQRMRRSGRYGA